MSVRDEFEKAFPKDGSLDSESHQGAALAGALWMAERCAKDCENIAKSMDNEWNKNIGKRDDLVETAQDCADSLRQLAKELDQ